MSDIILRDEVIALIEEKQSEVCPAGRRSRRYVYGEDLAVFDGLQEIIDKIEAIPAIDQEQLIPLEADLIDRTAIHHTLVAELARCIRDSSVDKRKMSERVLDCVDAAPRYHPRRLESKGAVGQL